MPGKNRFFAPVAGLFLVLLFLAACKIVEGPVDSSSSSDYDEHRDEGDGGLDSFEFEITPNREAAEFFSGTWAQLHVVSHISNLPGYSAVATSSIMWQLVEAEAEPAGVLAIRETICDMILETPDMPVDTIVPRAFITHLVPVFRIAVVEGIDPGSAFESDVMTEVRGCLLDDPIHDELCCAPEDERVLDQDEDGLPGMTLNFTGAVNAQVYVSQRWDSRFYNAAVADADHISGYVESNSEQQVLESTNPVFDGPDPDPPELGSWPDPDPEHSYFELVRLPDGADCGDVMDLGLAPRE